MTFWCICRVCGQEMAPSWSSQERLYCSIECRRLMETERRKARQRVESLERQEALYRRFPGEKSDKAMEVIAPRLEAARQRLQQLTP